MEDLIQPFYTKKPGEDLVNVTTLFLISLQGRPGVPLRLCGFHFEPEEKMFGFHKPKMYRSIEGCCICRAKSSSSQFTDGKRYEKYFQSCFRLHETPSGDICNACMLLVKRWKKLPAGSKTKQKTKNWNHVVDAKAGPSLKTTLKPKKVKTLSRNSEKQPDQQTAEGI